MMAQHPEEAAIITASAGAVMLNLGNITDVRKQSMIISADTAKEKGVPMLLDICGAACLPTRKEFALKIITASLPSVVKGNYSEILALLDDGYSSSGVDADKALTTEQISTAAKELAKKLGTVILASGKTDIVTDGNSTVLVHNGTAQLGSITGTGCMQGALCSAYLAAADGFDAAVAASAVFGICGELAQTDKGAGTFGVNLLDALCTVTDEQITTLARIEAS